MKSAKALYQELERHRQPFLDRARDSAALTIPSLMPPEGHNSTVRFRTPWQSIGSRGVNNLSSKLLLTLLPPNTPIFRLVVDPFVLDSVNEIQDAESEIQQGLSKIEKAVASEIETLPMRPQFFEGGQHLVVAGNICMFLPESGPIRNFPLTSYVVDRDPKDNILSLVTVEKIAPEALPEAARTVVKDTDEQAKESADKEKSVEIHTATVMTGPGRWKTWQEANGKLIPGTEGEYTEDTFPYLALRWSYISGESYGRGHVEMLLGDLKSLEGLAQSIVEAAAAASRVVFTCRPGGATRIEKLAKAENGAIIPGDPEDVHAIQAEKSADLAVAAQVAERIERRLSFAFLLNSSVQRNAERVTAEEIRYMAQELEDTLGGVYSLLGSEFQLPLVKLIMGRMERQERLPKLNKKVAKPSIITGLDALGRGHDLQRLQVAVAAIQQGVGPEALAQAMNVPEYIKRVFVASGVTVEGLVKTQEQIAQEQQAAQQAALVQNAAPEVVKGVVKSATGG